MFDIAVQCGGIGQTDELPLIESQINENTSDIEKMTVISKVVAENSASQKDYSVNRTFHTCECR